MSLLEILTPQPNFPDEDLQEDNIAHVEYYLQNDPGTLVYEKDLRESMRMLHVVGHNALQICGVEVDYSEDEYHAFCEGFAALEYASILVRQKQLSGSMMIANTRNLLIDMGEMTDFEVASRHGVWMEAHPNTFGVVTKAGAVRSETMKQLQARAVGAHIASELQAAA
ncbi:hypothetical protein KI440_01760 [Candidatus Saccharibacteria bacterium TM7i]|nr:hypothetical protein KI440_01760 [Candidatus Saccharibacteria bacterium TM7i]